MPTAYAEPAPHLNHSAKARPAKVRPSLALRLRVRWNAAQLDAALADGADPDCQQVAGPTSPAARGPKASRQDRQVN